MARRKRSERDTSDIATPEFDLLLAPRPAVVSVIKSTIDNPLEPMIDAEDRRRYNPSGVFANPRNTAGVPSRLHHLDMSYKFSNPKSVLVCVRRKQRREVLFAKKKTRSGAGARRKRNDWSDVQCS